MVTISTPNKINNLSNAVYRIFRLQEFFTHIKEVENPEVKPCIYAMWHAHQFCIHGISDRKNLNVLISRSNDGEIIAKVVEKWGFKTVRGSKGKKGSVEASMQLISHLEDGECAAMMVDGPSGPARVAKDGIVKIAKLSGAPIVPVLWHSKDFNWFGLPSWDKLRMPVGNVRLINLYGDAIYVDKNGSEADDKDVLAKLQHSLEELEIRADEEWDKVYKFRLWQKKK